MRDKEVKPVDIKILYLCVHKKLNDMVNFSRIMKKKDFFFLLGCTYHIPKSLRLFVLKEMEKLNMIEDLGSRSSYDIKVNPLIMDPEENLSKFYKELGIWK